MKINEKPSNVYLIFEGRMEDISLEKKKTSSVGSDLKANFDVN